MERLVILTVGKTHSGKTTFANSLEKELSNTVVIDQDNHAEFIHTHYKSLLPDLDRPNKIKYAITQTIVEYAINESDSHLVLSNSNLNREGRLKLLEYYHNKGFRSIIVSFEIPNYILKERVAGSKRSTSILRVATTFDEVLKRQEKETNKGNILLPEEGEADTLFRVRKPEEIQSVIKSIKNIAQIGESK